MQVARRRQRLVERRARHDDGDGARGCRLGDVRLGEIEDLHVAAMQHAPVVAGFADQAARCVELHQIMVEPVSDGLVPVAHETLAVEIDRGDQQAAQVPAAHRRREAAVRPVVGRRRHVENDRDALLPGVELIAWPQMSRGEQTERKLGGLAHTPITNPLNPARSEPSAMKNSQGYRAERATNRIKNADN